jgi:hypothetical protein
VYHLNFALRDSLRVRMFPVINSDCFFKPVDFLMVKCSVIFEVPTELLNVYYLDELQFQMVKQNTLYCSRVDREPSFGLESD